MTCDRCAASSFARRQRGAPLRENRRRRPSPLCRCPGLFRRCPLRCRSDVRSVSPVLLLLADHECDRDPPTRYRFDRASRSSIRDGRPLGRPCPVRLGAGCWTLGPALQRPAPRLVGVTAGRPRVLRPAAAPLAGPRGLRPAPLPPLYGGWPMIRSGLRTLLWRPASCSRRPVYPATQSPCACSEACDELRRAAATAPRAHERGAHYSRARPKPPRPSR